MRITYFGHSALKIVTGPTTLLADPFISGNPLAESVTSVGEQDPNVILLTHAHFDHYGDTPEILKGRPEITVVANLEIAGYIERTCSHTNSVPLNTGGSTEFPWGKVTSTPALHSSSFPDGTYGGSPGGFVVETGGKTLYLAGDTAPFSEMRWIGEDFDIDVAFLPIGDFFTMGLSGSLRAAKMLSAGITVPIHYNTFEPIRADTTRWLEMMEAAGLGARVVAPGETIEI